MSTPLIEARRVTKILSGVVPVTLVRDINLKIMPREFIAITGPSGSGKSSLLYLLGLLDLPTDGDVLIDGRSTTAMTEDERAEVRLARLGFVFQFHFLLPEFSITENVALPMRALGRLSPRAILARAEELLGSLGLGDHRRKTPDQLSGGQRQRVAVARALANDPPVILADEPTGSLDSVSTAQVFGILRDLVALDGKTVVAVTHDLNLAAQMHRRIHVVDGQLQTDAPARPTATRRPERAHPRRGLLPRSARRRQHRLIPPQPTAAPARPARSGGPGCNRSPIRAASRRLPRPAPIPPPS